MPHRSFPQPSDLSCASARNHVVAWPFWLAAILCHDALESSRLATEDRGGRLAPMIDQMINHIGRGIRPAFHAWSAAVGAGRRIPRETKRMHRHIGSNWPARLDEDEDDSRSKHGDTKSKAVCGSLPGEAISSCFRPSWSFV